MQDEPGVRRPLTDPAVRDGVLLEVDPGALPYTDEGLPGSLLDVACAAGVPIDHACGGVCACSTCHVVIEEGFETLNPISEDEEDMLDEAENLEKSGQMSSRGTKKLRYETRKLTQRLSP